MRIKDIKTITKKRFVILFEAEYFDRKNIIRKWEFFSRKSEPFGKKCDTVMIVPFIGNKIVFIKQFRVPSNGYIYEFPAGIVDGNETVIDTAKRELKEEVGLSIVECKVGERLYNSVGISSETVSLVFAKVIGDPTICNCEDSEEIEIMVKNRKEVKFLIENNLSVDFCSKCWLILNSFSNGYDWI